MAISDYLMQIPLKKANPTADALEAYARAQAPQMQANTARGISDALLRRGGLLTDIAGMFFGAKADKVDAQNAQAMQQYAQDAGLAQTLRDWNREDAVAQRNRNWALEDAQTARENKTADMLERYAREDALAQRNRDWALQDRSAQWERQDRLAADNAAADALEKYAAEQAQKAQEEQKNQEDLDAAKIRYQNAQELVRQLNGLVDEATHTPVGRKLDSMANFFGFTTDGAEAEERYRQIVNNEMIPRIREYMGAAVTAEEVQRVIGLLGDPTAAPEKKRAALNSFLEAAERNLRNKQDLANGTVGVVNDNPLGL